MAKKRDIPSFEWPIIETHCHLDYLKDLSLPELLSKCSDHNIEKIMTISVAPDNLDQALTISKMHEEVFCSQGIHPHEASSFNAEVFEKIKINAQEKEVLAIGEIGLDYHYNKSPRKKQIETFETLLQLACDLDKPVIIHSRDADEDTSAILDNFANKLKRKGVIHSYTSGTALAEHALNLGMYLGFNGIITFKNAENVRQVLKTTPLERVLLETDAPFLTPAPYRGRENAPFYLPFIAEKVAETLDLPLENILKTCYQNSLDLFDFPS